MTSDFDQTLGSCSCHSACVVCLSKTFLSQCLSLPRSANEYKHSKLEEPEKMLGGNPR